MRTDHSRLLLSLSSRDVMASMTADLEKDTQSEVGRLNTSEGSPNSLSLYHPHRFSKFSPLQPLRNPGWRAGTHWGPSLHSRGLPGGNRLGFVQ